MLNAHHVIGCTAMSTRWHEPNMCCLCSNHHVFSSEFSAHLTPTLFTLWIIKKRGKKWHADLEKKHREIKQYTDEELINLRKELNDKYKGGNKAKEKK